MARILLHFDRFGDGRDSVSLLHARAPHRRGEQGGNHRHPRTHGRDSHRHRLFLRGVDAIVRNGNRPDSCGCSPVELARENTVLIFTIIEELITLTLMLVQICQW